MASSRSLPVPPDPALPRGLLDALTDRGLSRRQYDIVVVGAGVAGLAFTLRLPAGLRVALLTKGALGQSNTRYAQGGLAAAVGQDDSPDLHEADTLAAGAGLCDPVAVKRLVEAAPAAVDWLLALGTRFDRAGDEGTGELLLGREAAHSRRRVLHAGGDATGAEIERALVAGVREDPAVDVFEGAFAVDLIVRDGRCAGIVAELGPDLSPTALDAPVVVLAAGGAGQIWATTSNPAGATADGLAIALRAGVAIADFEFTQFHPTVLALPGSTPFLVSEAVRGEGAFLRGVHGLRFMPDLHPLAELAPRDVVARAIQQQMAIDQTDHVWLDLRHLDSSAMCRRFPTIARELAARGLDLATDLIPVAPAAHYFMGGVVAGTTGETSLPGLLALGEAACTGVHGANRLASNSLLEGLVFGLDAADHLNLRGIGTASEPLPPSEGNDSAPSVNRSSTSGDRVNTAALWSRLRRAMSRQVAVVRDAEGLASAQAEIAAVATHLPQINDGETRELRNAVLVGAAVVEAAAQREESRGAHFRTDYPERNPALAGRHLVLGGAQEGWRFASLREAQGEAAGAV